MPWSYKKYGAGKGYWKRGSGWSRGASWNKGGTVKRSFNAAKSYKTGVKNEYFNCSVNGYVTFNFESGNSFSDVNYFIPYKGGLSVSGSGASTKYVINDTTKRHGAAVLDRGFRLMCAQYDELKLVSMKVKLMPSDTITSNWAIKVASVIDRNFNKQEDDTQVSGGTNMTDNEPQTAQSIFASPGVLIQNFNANKIYPMPRMCYVKDLKEKSDFVDASVHYTDTASMSPLTTMWVDSWSDEKTTFSPCFFYALQTNMAPSAPGTITMNYTVEYNFVFRNPKSGLDRFLKFEQVGYTNSSGAKSAGTKEDDEIEPAATAAARSVSIFSDETTPTPKLK